MNDERGDLIQAVGEALRQATDNSEFAGMIPIDFDFTTVRVTSAGPRSIAEYIMEKVDGSWTLVSATMREGDKTP